MKADLGPVPRMKLGPVTFGILSAVGCSCASRKRCIPFALGTISMERSSPNNSHSGEHDDNMSSHLLRCGFTSPAGARQYPKSAYSFGGWCDFRHACPQQSRLIHAETRVPVFTAAMDKSPLNRTAFCQGTTGCKAAHDRACCPPHSHGPSDCLRSNKRPSQLAPAFGLCMAACGNGALLAMNT